MEYSVIRSGRRTVAIQLKPDGSVIARAPHRVSDAQIRAFVEQKKSWIEKHQATRKETEPVTPFSHEEIQRLAEKAVVVIPERVRYYAPIVGVDYGRITIRNQRSRWGSCSGKGNLNFNCLLMLLPQEVIDSVVVHELCHRKHMNHSKAFYDEVESVFPVYKKCRKWLKENGHIYLSRLP